MKSIDKLNLWVLAVCVVAIFGLNGCLSSLNSAFKDGYHLNLNANDMLGDGKNKSNNNANNKEPKLETNTVLNIKEDGVLEVVFDETYRLADANLYGRSGKCQKYHYYLTNTGKRERSATWVMDTYRAPELVTKDEYDKFTTKKASNYTPIFGKDAYSNYLYFKSKGCQPKLDGTYKLEVTVYDPNATAIATADGGFKFTGEGETFTFELLSDDK